METTFTERLLWARHRKGLGANKLARAVGCAQALISNLENGNAQGSPKYNNAFAKTLGVTPNWLAHGDDPQPEGFTEAEVKKLRAARASGTIERPMSLGRSPEPRWAEPVSSVNESEGLGQAARLQKSILSDFMDYSRLAGGENARAFIELLRHYVDSVLPGQNAEGQNKVVAVEQGHRRTKN